MALGRTRFNLSFRQCDGLQARFATCQLLGYIQPLGERLVIGTFGPHQQVFDLGQQLRLELLRVPIRQRLVARSVGVQLGTVERHRTELH